MKTNDPFSPETDKVKSLLREDSRKPDEVEYEVISSSVNTFMDSHAPAVTPGVFQEVTHEVADHADDGKKSEIAAAFNQLFTDLNQKYGLNVSLDFDSFSNSLEYMISPKNKEALEYYLSEAYGRFRVVLYGQYLQAIATLSAQILDPDYLLSESMSYDQKLDTMQRLYEFMSTMNDIYKEVNIPNAEMKLEKMSDDERPDYSINDPEVRKVLSALNQSLKLSSGSEGEQ